MTESTPPEATAKTAPAEKCRDLKRGRVDLHCTLPRGHADGKDGTWHEAMYTDHQMITYDGATHTVHVTEHVTWEPLDHVREAVRHLMAGRRDDG